MESIEEDTTFSGRVVLLKGTIPSHASAITLPSIEHRLREDPAWLNALAEVKANSKLTADMLELTGSTTPNDLLEYVESTKQRQRQSKHTKTMRVLDRCSDCIRRHEKSIDMFAQAGGMSGCLAWGTIRVALQVHCQLLESLELSLVRRAEFSDNHSRSPKIILTSIDDSSMHYMI